MNLPQPRDWLAVLDDLGPLLEETTQTNQVSTFLRFLRDEFGWPVVEYWRHEGEVFRRVDECHMESDVLDAFMSRRAKEIPVDWARREIWPERDPGLRKAAWIVNPADLPDAPDRELLRETGLHTLVVIPVPNGTVLHRNIVLWNFEPRSDDATEIHALRIAAFLLGRGLRQEVESALPESPLASTATMNLDPHTRRLVGPGGSERLTVYEWDFLAVLFEREGEAVSFKDLIQEVWGAPEEYVGRSVVYELVARLRSRLRQISLGSYRISSAPRYGYTLERLPNETAGDAS